MKHLTTDGRGAWVARTRDGMDIQFSLLAGILNLKQSDMSPDSFHSSVRKVLLTRHSLKAQVWKAYLVCRSGESPSYFFLLPRKYCTPLCLCEVASLCTL